MDDTNPREYKHFMNRTSLRRKESLRDSCARRAKASGKPRYSSIARQSPKAKALVPLRRACCEAVRARSGGRCEARLPGCTGAGQDVHEIRARSAGGSITDPENALHLCRHCHTYTIEHANAARALGLVAPRGA